jgi:(p)ppGpp synthase/HD superfamily hydrolase
MASRQLARSRATRGWAAPGLIAKIYSHFGRLGVRFCPVTGRRRLPDVVARLPKTRAALEYAKRQHAGQRRSSDGAAFIEHPLEVGWLLYRAGAPDHVIAAGVLHDVLEKTVVSDFELSARFGSRIAHLVQSVSEDQSISGYQRRKAALRRQAAAAGPEALMIFAADKVSKVGELRAALSEAARRRESRAESLVPSRRLAHFKRCLGMLEEQLGDSPLVRQLGTALAGLAHDLERSGTTRVAA